MPIDWFKRVTPSEVQWAFQQETVGYDFPIMLLTIAAIVICAFFLGYWLGRVIAEYP